MKSGIRYLIFIVLIIFIFAAGSASASDLQNATLDEVCDESLGLSLDNVSDNLSWDPSDEITVDSWDDLQLYCSKDDANYVLRLKEDTNFYPTNPSDENYRIVVNNNVTILGSSGAYFGDSSPDARPITYLAINVAENSGLGITLKGVTFKWINAKYQPNAGFLQMAGNSNNYIEDCLFTNSTLDGGHSSLVYLLRGYASITNCTFTDITSDYGAVSIYDPKDDATKICTGARMDVADSYFEGNFAKSEPGCINNCGVLVVSNSTFYRNTATQWAGAIHTHGGANTTIYDSNFTDNLAGWNGGALYTYSYLQIYNTIFMGNNCTTNNGGGAIGAYNYLTSPHIHIQDSLFKGNENLCWSLDELSTTGTGRGGAISFWADGSIVLLNNTFIKNSASIGTAVCVYSQGEKSPADTIITGNKFINHTRIGDVLVVKVNSVSLCNISDNYYLNNSIEFSKLKLIADEKVGDEVTLHLEAALSNDKYYDSDILDRFDYYVYVDGKYYMTVTGRDFTLNMKNLQKCQVYVVPSISTSKSNEVTVGLPKEYIYVSQKNGNDANKGSTRQSPVATIAKACELASSCGNIVIMDGTFTESNLTIAYDLNIRAEGDVKFTGTLSNTIFTVVNNSDFSISNIRFDGISFKVKDTGIIRQSKGLTTIESCIFNGNHVSGLTGNNLIEASTIEVYNSNFTNNNKNYIVLIKSNEFLIDNCIFLNNLASQTVYSSLVSTTSDKAGVKGTVTNSVFKSNTVKYGCIYFGANDRPLMISNTRFIANKVASTNDHSSCIKLEGSSVVVVDSCTFVDNVDLGSRSAAIYVSGGSASVGVTNSIILNNSYANSNGVVFSASNSANLKVYNNLNGNWWGNTYHNYTVSPAVYADACDNWLFLNVTTNSTLSKGQKVLITFDLNNLAARDGKTSHLDASKLDEIRFKIKTSGGVAGDSEMAMVNGVAKTTFTLTSFDWNFTAVCDGFEFIIDSNSKTKPTMIVNVSDIYVGESAVVEIGFLENVGGNLTIFNETKEITGSKTIFTLNNLNAGVNVIDVSYSGDDHYLALRENATVNVYKCNSTTKISYGDVGIGKDVTLTIDVTDTATGNITLTINNRNETLALNDSRAYYTIKSIARGNYNITAVYGGDSKYKSSSDNVKFGVGRIKPAFSVTVGDNIVYGEDAVVNVVLNSNATGNVNVNVDGKTKTAKLENGQAHIPVSGLNVGLQTVYVDYDGDDYYDSYNASVSFNVIKADTILVVDAKDIMVGSAEAVEVSVASGVTGNITIVCGEYTITKSVNVLGKVSWTLSDLAVGQYMVSATLTSDNYNSVENTTEFKVSDYSPAQWPNQGYDVGNAGKSPYISGSNGAILWSSGVEGDVMKNIAVDSEGNICIVTTSGVYSLTNSGSKRWNYDYVSSNISGISISREVVIVPIAGNSLFFVNQTTGERFGYSHVYQGSSLFEPVVDSNSNVYISSEYQHASGTYNLVVIPYRIWPQGGNPTLISLGKSQPVSAPIIVGDDYAVVTCSDGIKIIDLTKNEISATISAKTQSVRPVAGDGNMIYAVLNNNVQAITLQGNTFWKTAIPGGSANCLALDEENGLYLINSLGNLYRYDVVDGSAELLSGLNFTSGILIGNDGNLYVGLNEMLYAFDKAGNILWKSDMGASIVGTPVMDENGIIYLTTSDSLKAIGNAGLAGADFDVSVKDISAGENATVAINVACDLTGKITVEIDSKNYTGVISDNNITISVPDLASGHKTALVRYSGDGRFKSKEVSSEFVVFGDSQIIASNATSYFGNKYVVSLTDSQGNAIVGEKITVSLGNNEYALISDKNGEVAIDLDMGTGVYQVISAFSGNDYLKPSNKTTKLTVLSTIQASEMIRGYNSSVDYKATFLTKDGALLSNDVVSFVVNGKVYSSTTDKSGVATLNANLGVGSYDVVVVNPKTGENATQKLKIVERITDNRNLTMDYLDGSVYRVRILGDDGNYVGAGEVVTFKINGKTSTAKTDSDGYAKLSIKLVPKTYTVTAEYMGYKVSNKVVVKQVLKTKDVTKKKAKSYKYQATLKTSKGKAIVGKKITFKIKGKTYSAKTNKKGVATVTIKLNLKVGKYTITTTYSKTSKKNKLTIKK